MSTQTKLFRDVPHDVAEIIQATDSRRMKSDAQAIWVVEW